MPTLDSPLLRELISFLKRNRRRNGKVELRRSHLSYLVIKIRSVVTAADGRTFRNKHLMEWRRSLRSAALLGQNVLDDDADQGGAASRAKRLLAGIRSLFLCSSEVEKLSRAVKELESKAVDLPIFIKLLELESSTETHVAAAAAPVQTDAATGSAKVAVSVVAGMTNPEAKKKQLMDSGDGGNAGEPSADQPARARLESTKRRPDLGTGGESEGTSLA